MIANVAAARNMITVRFSGFSGIGVGLLGKVMVVPSVVATIVPDSMVQ